MKIKRISEIIEILKLLDQELIINDKFKSKTIDLIIFGGTSLILHNVIERATKDIDVFVSNLEDETKKEFVEIAKDYGLDFRGSTASGMFDDSFPEEFIKHDYNNNFKILKLKIPTIEFIVLTKIHSMRPQDQRDILNNDDLLSKIDEKKFKKMAKTMHDYMIEGEEKRDFFKNINIFLKKDNIN